MPKKHVYSKDSTGYGDFIYVDLLPEVRRSRQFNMNVILALLFAVVLGFFVIYRPYSDAIFELEEVSSINSDLKHELKLTEEEFAGYEIDLEAIEFQSDIDQANLLRLNFNNLVDDVQLIVDVNGGRIKSINYDGEDGLLRVEVAIISQFSYNTLNNQLLSLDWVDTSIYTTPTRYAEEIEYTSIFVIGVDYNAE